MNRLLILICVAALFSCTANQSEKESITSVPANPTEKTGFIDAGNDIKLYYEVRGNGKDTLVMINGGPGLSLNVIAPDWVEMEPDYTMIFYDQRGGGQSTLPDTNTIVKSLHIDRFIEDLEMVRQYFSLSKMTLIGHSFGPMIVSRYAIKYPENVKKMLYIGSLPPYKGNVDERKAENENNLLTKEQLVERDAWEKKFLAGEDYPKSCLETWKIWLITCVAAGIPVETIKGDHCPPLMESAIYGYKYSMMGTYYSMGDWDLREGLKNLHIPTLVVHGVEEAIPMEMVEEWVEYLPEAKLEKIEGAAHFPHVEKPGVVWPIIKGFLSE